MLRQIATDVSEYIVFRLGFDVGTIKMRGILYAFNTRFFFFRKDPSPNFRFAGSLI